MSAPTITWGHSKRGHTVHAWTGERWCGDAIALCQQACPAQDVICA